MSAKSEPSFTRPLGLIADSKISRTSASMLRPCRAAGGAQAGNVDALRAFAAAGIAAKLTGLGMESQ